MADQPGDLVCVAHGPGWALFWPAGEWAQLGAAEQAAEIAAAEAAYGAQEEPAGEG